MSTDHLKIDRCEITEGVIDLNAVVEDASVDEAGAVSTFSGITRNNFNNKKVVRLEYEAYTPMAVKEMQALCQRVREKWDVFKITMIHRIGVVPVREASIVIAISSAHRGASLEAVHFAIDELKARVPVWKKEIYEDGSEWKENKEYTLHKPTQST
eukprot:GFYU01004294.1.p1 GENE.GFYU01004294.1~~GFYU01004294.1.p1  ORF type:complete len:156 (-),score=51.18 GFYU01004294.1:192-659(-)